MRNRRPKDPRAAVAWRAIKETEAFLHTAMYNPTVYKRIPVIRVGYGEFPPGLSEQYWPEALDIQD